MTCAIFIGFDPRETAAFAVCRHSIQRRLSFHVPIKGIVLDEMRERGLYRRPTEVRDGKLWDVISDAPCATEFSISRFLTPILATDSGPAEWALFLDCDMMARADLGELFAQADPQYAVMCVKHVHEPPEGVKMDNQIQTRYARKNWSSCMLFNVGHQANAALTVDLINTVPGRDLHRFCWLKDEEIGALDVEWNWLVGHSDPAVSPSIVHFTDGIPTMAGYENVPFADEWRAELRRWVWGENG